ncbi:hypothetical protein PM082_018637 [Marasmius tenuissimus]|nr:hypothetical protein PM082_018637 [Marasmius tenuissimus]
MSRNHRKRAGRTVFALNYKHSHTLRFSTTPIRTESSQTQRDLISAREPPGSSKTAGSWSDEMREAVRNRGAFLEVTLSNERKVLWITAKKAFEEVERQHEESGDNVECVFADLAWAANAENARHSYGEESSE